MTGITRHRSFWILYAIASAAALVVAVRLFPLASEAFYRRLALVLLVGVAIGSLIL